MTAIFEQIPSFDARTHRRSSNFTDTPEPQHGRIRREYEVERIPYSDLRAEAYPGLGDQLDAVMKGFRALLDAGISIPPDTAAWVEACEKVKETYPK